MSNLSEIIAKSNKTPTIINENSNFVVVTYWWGKGNLNGNTARPCISFYENIINSVRNLCIRIFNSSPKKNIQTVFNNLEKILIESNDFKKITRSKAMQYQNMIYSYCNISESTETEENKNIKALKCLENYKLNKKTPESYEFKTIDYIEKQFEIVSLLFVYVNKQLIFKLYHNKNMMDEIKNEFMSDKSNKEHISEIKQKIASLTQEKNKLIAEIKSNMNKPFDYDLSNLKMDIDISDYKNKSIFAVLNNELRFLNPLKFEEMITEWENKCAANKCNYLAIEYPEFAKPGGYQMAINAKPLFIKKTLELCKNRNVLYIDGDMTINRYPEIFDMQDVDFMARGWWIDPRSSYKMDESITYDPYTFETSGGTMFFSQSIESQNLINVWIEESDKPYQKGKADDRILSMIFNTKKFLLNMKIIQLPVEYLWLTLDYDDRILELIYDYDIPKMKESIYIEHPECLTSEDTAVGAGASSDRTPKFYSFLEDISPVSETVHEYIMFPTKDMTKAFSSYFNYMNSTVYIDDGNQILYEKGLVDVDAPENNEMPLYIINYDDKLGNQKINYEGEKYSPNEIADINYRRAKNMNLQNIELIKSANNVVEIQNKNNILKESELVSLIIRLLLDGNTVIYNPVNKTDYDINIYNILKQNLDTKYKNLNLVFSPLITGNHRNDYYRPKISTNQAILFRPQDNKLINLLSMFISLEQLSDYFNRGTYEFMSRIRIGYVFKPKATINNANNNIVGGNNNDINLWIEEYNDGLNLMYGSGNKKYKRINKTKKIIKKYIKRRKTKTNKSNKRKNNKSSKK
jgi:hypothetical protein